MEKKSDTRKYYSSSTFSRTSRPQEILEKANSLVQVLRSKHAKTDEMLAKEYQESTEETQIPQRNKCITEDVEKLREELAANLKLGVLQNNNMRSMDSVFGDDHESLWVKDFRKLHKPRLSFSVTRDSKSSISVSKQGLSVSKNKSNEKNDSKHNNIKISAIDAHKATTLNDHILSAQIDTELKMTESVESESTASPRDCDSSISEMSLPEHCAHNGRMHVEAMDTVQCHSESSSFTSSRHSSLYAARVAAHAASAPTTLPQIDFITESRYFGKQAKQQFYATYHELLRQSDHLVNGTDDIISCLDRDTTTEESVASIARLRNVDKTFASLTVKRPGGSGYNDRSREDSDKSLESWDDFDEDQSSDEDEPKKGPGSRVSQVSSITEAVAMPPKTTETTKASGGRKHSQLDKSRPTSTLDGPSSKEGNNSVQFSSTVTLPVISRDKRKQSQTVNSQPQTGLGLTAMKTVSAAGGKPKAKPKPLRRLFSRGSGESVQSDFLSAFSKSTVVAADTVVSTSSSYRPSSPRAKFLAGCIKLGIIPRTKIMLRPEYSHVLDLEHQSMGDKMGKLLAAGLNAMPNITVINLADNNLTDDSLKPLLDAISVNPNIVELDLSENKLDEEASEALGAYLAHPNCRLRCLRMRHADVDDGECHAMVEKIMNNHSLLELDLSRNLLGKDENLNAIKPEITTAGEALAVLLRLGNCALQKLKISWNMIRMDGARDLCESVAFCHLTHLDMSFNALSNDAGIELGVALHHNKRLKELVVCNNGMGPAACVCICVGIRECLSLERVSLDGNSLGEQGARALISIPMERTDDIIVTTKGCNLNLKEERCWLDISEPEGEYRVDMENGYDRAAFFEILRALSSDPVYQLTTCEYSEDGKIWEKKRLVRYFDKSFHMSESERTMLEELKYVRQATETEQGRADIFNRFKEIGSRGLNKSMFFELIQFLKCKFNTKSAHALFDIYDIDKSGYLDEGELMDFLISHSVYVSKQIADIETKLVVGESRDGVSASTRFIPPKQGLFHIVIHNSRHRGYKRRAITPGQVDRLVKFANQSSDATRILVLGVQATELNLNEAMSMYDHLVHSLGNAVSSLTVLLPSMANDLDSRKMIDIYISDHVTLSRLLRHQLGTAYRPIVGNYTGYYCLDLKRDKDRACFQKLLERSNLSYYSRKEKDLGDISQNGDRSSFRNGLLNNETHCIDGTAYSMIPPSGKLEFDFVDTIREDYVVMDAITDKRLIELLLHMRLLPDAKVEWAHGRLTELHDAMERVLRKPGLRYWECPSTKANEIGDYLRKGFYPNLARRRQQFSEAISRERKLLPLTKDDDDDSSISSALEIGSTVAKKVVTRTANVIASKSSRTPGKSTAKKTKRESIKKGDVQPNVDTTMSKSQAIKENLMRHRTEKFYRTISRFTSDLNVPSPGIAANIVAFFDELFGMTFLRCRHVVVILEAFTGGRLKKTDYGSYHTELVITLFQHIKDLHNFELVLSALPSEEHANVLGRLGFLTLFNPVRPEGSVRLHLGSYEQRQVAKILMHLSLDEPAENWVGETYSSSPDLPPMPGWQLSVVWFTEEGLPRFGVLTTRYYSGEGVEGDGFAPNVALRQALLSLVLVHPNDIRSEFDEAHFVNKPVATLTECHSLLRKREEVTWSYDPTGRAPTRAHVDRQPTRSTKR